MATRRALKAVLIDLSGTLHVEDTAVPGAQDALNRSVCPEPCYSVLTQPLLLSCSHNLLVPSECKKSQIRLRFVLQHASVPIFTQSLILWVSSEVTRSLCDLYTRLRQSSVAVKFVTNTTKECKRNLVERLHSLNFDIQEQEIFTSLTAARSLVEQRQLRPLLLVADSALEDFSGERQG